MGLWEKICSPSFLQMGWERVKRNHGKPGVDGITISEFERQLDENLNTLAEEIKEEKYEPHPILRVSLQEKDKERSIGISCVRDRVVQQSLYLLLTPLFEPDFLECSYAYRQGKNALMAVNEVQRQLLSGKCWVMETDITHFFDNINHSLLISRIREKVYDDRITHLVLRCLKVNLFSGMNILEVELGVSQGSALSPLLGNIYLNPVDREMSRHGFSYLRYSDDVLVLAESKEEAESAFNTFKTALSEIGLEPKMRKTRIIHAREGFQFLGYHFDLFGKGPSVGALEGLRERLRLLNQQAENISFADHLSDVEAVLRGWEEYFGPANAFEPEDLYTLFALMSSAKKRKEKNRLDELASLRYRITGGDEAIRFHIANFWLENNHKGRAIEEAGRLLLERPDCREAREFIIKLLGLSEVDAASIIELILQAYRESCEEDYLALAEAYAEKGFFELAMEMQAFTLPDSSERLTDLVAAGKESELESEKNKSQDQTDTQVNEVDELAMEELSEISGTKDKRSGELDLADEDVNLFIQLFGGREGFYAREKVDEEGRRSFISVERPLTATVVKKHLSGETTVGQYIVRSNQTVRYLVIDIDVSKRILLTHGDKSDEFKKHLEAAHHDAKRILAAAASLALPMCIEDSGYRGRHCWLFFECAVRAADARELGQALCRRAGNPSEGVNWEVFPNSGKVKTGNLGPLIKLPLGKHGKSGRFSLFMDAGGEPAADQAAFLRKIKAISQSRFEELLGIVKSILQDGAKLPEAEQVVPQNAGEKGKQAHPDKKLIDLCGPLVQKVVQRCILIAHLLDKVEKTGYLTHQERLTLLMVFGHLGEEGLEFLHRALSRCINYSRDVTDRYIRKLLLPKPISCPRLREFYPELTASLGCDCRFHLLPGTYPSPVLHSLANKGKDKKVTYPHFEESTKTESEPAYNLDADALIKKIAQIRKQIKQLQKGLDKHEKDLEGTFEKEKTNRLPVEMGTLVKVNGSSGRLEWIVEVD